MADNDDFIKKSDDEISNIDLKKDLDDVDWKQAGKGAGEITAGIVGIAAARKFEAAKGIDWDNAEAAVKVGAGGGGIVDGLQTFNESGLPTAIGDAQVINTNLQNRAFIQIGQEINNGLTNVAKEQGDNALDDTERRAAQVALSPDNTNTNVEQPSNSGQNNNQNNTVTIGDHTVNTTLNSSPSQDNSQNPNNTATIGDHTVDTTLSNPYENTAGYDTSNALSALLEANNSLDSIDDSKTQPLTFNLNNDLGLGR